MSLICLRFQHIHQFGKLFLPRRIRQKSLILYPINHLRAFFMKVPNSIFPYKSLGRNPSPHRRFYIIRWCDKIVFISILYTVFSLSYTRIYDITPQGVIKCVISYALRCGSLVERLEHCLYDIRVPMTYLLYEIFQQTANHEECGNFLADCHFMKQRCPRGQRLILIIVLQRSRVSSCAHTKF